MTIKFLKLHIHHFLSFDDSTIDLNDKGYCLVIGVNKNPRDAAKSNGSGKSTIWNAISYALTGETLSGLKTNLANNHYDDGCFVELEFEVDNDRYKLIRSRDDDTYGTNLKIYINEEDKSGKGIRESNELLAQYLPDLTSELLGSVIILGQGLPQKFTANSPSGRKEVLEHLSKSDFMIADLKDRIDARLEVLNNKYRVCEDSLLTIDAKETVLKEQVEENKKKLEELSQKTDFDTLIAQLEQESMQLDEKLLKIQAENDALSKEKDALNEKVNTANKNKQERLDKIYSQYIEYNKDISERKTLASSNKYQLEKEIEAMKNIRDVCPTCGQKIPGAVKPDTSLKEEVLKELNETYANILQEEKENNEEYENAKGKVNLMYVEEAEECTVRLKQIAFIMHGNEDNLKLLTPSYNTLTTKIATLKADKENHTKRLQEVKDKIKELEKSIEDFTKKREESTADKLLLDAHLKAIGKMNTLIKRDFRGVLLSGIIDFINSKAKEYSSKIFNTDNLEFVLDGNNIDIIFEGKDYENLSGGEKQRVDLIVQFAIRDMMSKYLKFSSNILVLDEITDALDSVSCDKVINFITSELDDISSVFIISHHASELQIPCDCELTVVKNELGLSEVIN